jgi:SAM-dependent methyltransferase
MELSDVQRRERDHHDELAASLSAAEMPPDSSEGDEAMLLAALGDIAGLDVLELGCGDGNMLLHLIDRGAASVTGVDISPGMVELARARVAHYRPQADARLLASPIEALDLEPASYDLIVGKWILHHVEVHTAAREIERLLRPGGTARFYENHARNRLLAFGREHLVGRFGIKRFGTEDEHLLVEADYDAFRERFSRVELEWPDFHFFGLVNRQLLRNRFRRIRALADRADRWVYRRLPRLRPYGFHVIIRLEK